jgi:hypothetical protein
MTTDGFAVTDIVLTLNEGGTFAVMQNAYGAPWMEVGTFTPATALADTDLMFTVGDSSGPDQPAKDSSYKLKYSNLTDHAAEVYLDPNPILSPGYDGPFDFIR